MLSTSEQIDALWDYDQPARSEERFRALLAENETADAGYRLQLLTQIARAQGLQQQFAAAAATLDEVEQELGLKPGLTHIRYWLECGRLRNSSGAPEAAIPYFLKAWDHACDQKYDFYAIDAAHMMGIAAPLEEQLDWHEKALVVAEASTDERATAWLGSLYNNIGWTHHDAGRYEAALAMFEKALAWREANGQVARAGIARWCVGRALRSLGRLEEALAIQERLRVEYDTQGAPSGYVFEELGELLLALGRREAAAPYFAQAYELLSQDPWLAGQQPERLERLRGAWQND